MSDVIFVRESHGLHKIRSGDLGEFTRDIEHQWWGPGMHMVQQVK